MLNRPLLVIGVLITHTSRIKHRVTTACEDDTMPTVLLTDIGPVGRRSVLEHKRAYNEIRCTIKITNDAYEARWVQYQTTENEISVFTVPSQSLHYTKGTWQTTMGENTLIELSTYNTGGNVAYTRWQVAPEIPLSYQCFDQIAVTVCLYLTLVRIAVSIRLL